MKFENEILTFLEGLWLNKALSLFVEETLQGTLTRVLCLLQEEQRHGGLDLVVP